MTILGNAKGGQISSVSLTQNLGFVFNPFEHKEASSDPNIGRYLIGHELFSLAREDSSAFVFAPPGGGKTAMRIFVTRACWMSLGGRHPFPIPYILPQHTLSVRHLSSDRHQNWITEAGARALLVSLIYRPERFLELPYLEQKRVAGLLNQMLSEGPSASPLLFYLQVLRESKTPDPLLKLLHWSGILTDLPSTELLQQLYEKLYEAAQSGIKERTENGNYFHLIMTMIRETFDFRSVFILLDGIDAYDETLHNPQLAANYLKPVVNLIKPFSSQGIYLKAFLPDDISPFVEEQFQDRYQDFQRVDLRWTPDLLAEMIRRRVYVASQGTMGSLDAISGPGLRDVESILAKSLKFLLPREMLVLVETLIQVYLQRGGDLEDSLTQEDIGIALERYRQKQISPLMVE